MKERRKEVKYLQNQVKKRKFVWHSMVIVGIVSFLIVGISGQKGFSKVALAKPAKQITIKLSHTGMQADDVHTVVVEQWAKLMEQRSNGVVNVEMYGACQLGSEQEQMKMARIGAPAVMGTAAVNNLEPFAPCLGFFVLPYMFPVPGQLKAVVDTVWDDINAKVIEQAGVRVVVFYNMGTRHLFNCVREVKCLSDLKGLKIRVPMNAIMMENYKAWGQPPITMAWSETFQALQQRVIEGTDIPYAIAYANKFSEVSKFGTVLNNYYSLVGVLVMGERFYQGLPKDIQKLVMECGKETADYGFEWMQEMELKYKGYLEQEGVKFATLVDEPEWEKRSRSIWPKFMDKFDKGIMDKVEKVKASVR